MPTLVAVLSSYASPELVKASVAAGVPSSPTMFKNGRTGERAIFLFGFAKSDRDNIDLRQTADFKAAAQEVLALTEAALEENVAAQMVLEVAYAEEN